MQMSPRRPYILRAHYDWMLDNQLTPHLVVDANYPLVRVPTEYVRDGQIVLNIVPHAVGNLELTNDFVRFSARFGGTPRQVVVPMGAVLAIYARENGAGTLFEAEEAYEYDPLAELEKNADSKLKLTDEPDANRLNEDGKEPHSPGKRPTFKVVE